MKQETGLRLFKSLRGHLFKQTKVIHKCSIEDTYSVMERSKPHCTKLALTNYEFNWLLHKKTLVEEFQEKVSPPLPCQIEIHAFVDLNKYADTENPRSEFSWLKTNQRRINLHFNKARKKPTTIASSDSAIKKRISFDNQQSSTSGSSIPFTRAPESSTQHTHQTSTLFDASPTKKSRPKID
ncbi:mitochondrial import inner membrane translocase [Striga asiatica]|uniref:Mitochondrial import inner membrane translocase n=1 Tax=Striga asiatica TaxID=4170 RepID=A0A5A7PR15_STRAF|nr:mitochondrial import inner membrane translocase [Striga asiatica]